MHTLLDLHGNIPTFIRITAGKVQDVNILDEFLPEAGAFYVMDRGYVDFPPLRCSRSARPSSWCEPKRTFAAGRYSHPVDRSTGLDPDHTVLLTSFNSAQAYPDPLAGELFLPKVQQAVEIPDAGTSPTSSNRFFFKGSSLYGVGLSPQHRGTANADSPGKKCKALQPPTAYPPPHTCRIYSLGPRWIWTLRSVVRSSDQRCLLSGFCSSGRGFVPRFLQTPPHGDALALP